MLLVNNLQEKCVIESQDGLNFGSTCAIRNLHVQYMKNALVFSQSDVPNFFMFIIRIYIKGSRLEKKKKIEMLRGLLKITELVKLC